LRSLIELNRRVSQGFDERFVPREMRADGNATFRQITLPRFLHPGMVVYDVGGGRRPAVSPIEKRRLGLRVVGVDIDETELSAAPAGAYDRIIAEDIAALRGRGDGDLVICQALLEHVWDVPAAVESIASLLKLGGRALIFVPSSKALFARINRRLPESLKRLILFGLYPETRDGHGFRSYYNHCTEKELESLGRRSGLTLIRVERFWMSSYFSFAAPLYAAWRAYQAVERARIGDGAAETLILIFERF
jgi:SAM-dependent methyltransferase